MPDHLLYQQLDSNTPLTLLREHNEWGLRTVDLVAPPPRFWADQERSDALVIEGLDLRRVRKAASPAALLAALPAVDNWQAMSRRTLARLHAYFLAFEDPQRRLHKREVDTLSHQVSLVRHILESSNLNRVLIADEVGLGKTIEVGLLLKELISQRPTLRILYLAPARLVSNVRREFERLNLPFRQWTATDADARLSDPRILASLHRAVFATNFNQVTATPAWDVLIVDECHHISAYSPEGADARQAYRLVEELIARQPPDARVVLMSGTPHQGHPTRFENLLALLKAPGESQADLSGRVIYRTKDDIQDWDGNPVFPARQVNEPVIVDLGPLHRQWLQEIYDFYRPPRGEEVDQARSRAAGWRCAQAMQWATSSPHAGLGYLVRQAIRADWEINSPVLYRALEALRPYRLGPDDESAHSLFSRIHKEVERQQQNDDLDDVETFVPGQASDPHSQRGLARLMEVGVALVNDAGDDKWTLIQEQLLDAAGDEKVVLFAQPIETVTALARFLKVRTGIRPALIIGGQSDEERTKEVRSFWSPDGPQYLVSSRAGGEGINLQISRRLIHVDVPWNPMDMEQRVGRVHRFGSRETVIVDTVVVKDSREWDAYLVARERLALIVQTMVEQERFESVYSRVMCLLPQDEYTGIMVNNFGAPLSPPDRDRLAAMVQQGFQRWRDFHDKYGRHQKSIQGQDPGLATWEDLASFLSGQAGASPLKGYKRQRFTREGNQVLPVEDQATVLQLPDGDAYVCADYGDFLVYGPDDQITPKLGVNLPLVAEALRRSAFPSQPTGAAHLRWPAGLDLPESVPSSPFGVLVFTRQTIQQERSGAWVERLASLHTYVIGQEVILDLTVQQKGHVLRGLLRATPRRSAAQEGPILSALTSAEAELGQKLRRPTDFELDNQIRHAVSPILAAVVTV